MTYFVSLKRDIWVEDWLSLFSKKPPPSELESFNSSVLSIESNKQLRALAKSLALDELRNNELVKDGEGILSVRDVKPLWSEKPLLKCMQ